jgi:hypothetical protein
LPEDLHHAIDSLPKDIVDLLKPRTLLNPPIADITILGGGFIRCTITGEKINDIDLFCTDSAQARQVSKDLYQERIHNAGQAMRLLSTRNAYSLLCPPKLPVQFIHRWTYPTAETLIDSFDFSIARAAIWWNASEERWRSLCDVDYYADLAAKRLRYRSPVREEDAGGSTLRVCKFLRAGYKISPESMAAVVSRLVDGVDQVDSGNESVRAKIIEGLLREVDPSRVIDGCEMPASEGATDITSSILAP